MLVLLVVMNFVISWFNAWGCGHAWAETKHQGGLAHFMNWMGAIMSASGFTWCYLVLMVTVGSHWDVTDKETGLVHPFLQPETAEMVFKLGYVVIIGPILGSGLAITIDTWAHFYRNRTLGNGALTAYNTYAQIYNTYQAVSYVPGFLGDIGDFFKSKDKDSAVTRLVIFLVVVSVVGGILTTYAILMSAAQSNAYAMNLKGSEAQSRQRRQDREAAYRDSHR